MSGILKSQRARLVHYFGASDTKEIAEVMSSMCLPYAADLPFHFREQRRGLSLLFLPYGLNIRVMPDEERKQRSHPFIAQPLFRHDLDNCSIGIFGNVLNETALPEAKTKKDDRILESTFEIDGFDTDEVDVNTGYVNILSLYENANLDVFEGFFPLVYDHNAYQDTQYPIDWDEDDDYVDSDKIEGVQQQIYSMFSNAFGEAFDSRRGRFMWEPLSRAFLLCAEDLCRSPMQRVLNSMSSHMEHHPEVVAHAAAYGEEMQAHVRMVLVKD